MNRYLNSRMRRIIKTNPAYEFVLSALMNDATGIYEMFEDALYDQIEDIDDLSDEFIIDMVEDIIYRSKH